MALSSYNSNTHNLVMRDRVIEVFKKILNSKLEQSYHLSE
jgi:hypothetical protein